MDHPRHCPVDPEDVSVHHSGILVITAANIALSSIVITAVQFTTFEFFCVRAVTGGCSAIIILYCCSSTRVQQMFFDELATLLDYVAICQDLLYIRGDFNICLDRSGDPLTD